MTLGVSYSPNGSVVRVWAPLVKELVLQIIKPQRRRIVLQPQERGYWTAKLPGDFKPGASYLFDLDKTQTLPDPASCFQPEGVHGPSEVVDHEQFLWADSSWMGVALKHMIFYELHVGTFSTEGTFAGVMKRLKDLGDLGVTAIELMPVAQFPGSRNWGYDGAFPFAVQNSYGGPRGLKALVDACHRQGLAVVLDVVYNHLGPEGNYLSRFGPYFTDRYKTPWGPAINFDGPDSDEVRNFFIENVLMWLRDYHIDALRLDAVHSILDQSAKPFLQELAEAVREFNRTSPFPRYLIAESDSNDSRLIRAEQLGGLGLDAQWSDDFHHCLHALLTGENIGYYADFGSLDQLAKAFRQAYVFTWDYSSARRRHHGHSPQGCRQEQFVACSQNHDQVGNRMMGERLPGLVSFESLKLASGLTILSPYLPLLFMGEEYGETNPFLFFVNYEDPKLNQAVLEGRRAEFKNFDWKGELPPPPDPSTFDQSRLQWEKRNSQPHRTLLCWYKRLLELRRSLPVFFQGRIEDQEASSDAKRLILLNRRWCAQQQILLIANFQEAEQSTKISIPNGSIWKKTLDSSAQEWKGPGPLSPQEITKTQEIRLAARCMVLYQSPLNPTISQDV